MWQSRYAPTTIAAVQDVISAIRERGAEVDLTDKGRKAGVWDATNGFCLKGNWSYRDIDGWTAPSTDSKGNIVTHIKAEIDFTAKQLGQANSAINPLKIVLSSEKDYDAVKFNDGWRIGSDASQ
jgi:hypothetical protein